jgi:hypothetical protein
MTCILRLAMTLPAAAIGCYAAAIQFACIVQGCSRSRVGLIFLACVAAATIAASLSAIIRHRFAPAILATTIPCLAAIYLFELVARTPHDRHTTQILAEVSRQRSRGIEAVPPYGYGIGAGVTLQDGNAVYPLTGPSERLVVLCQEGAHPPKTYQSDQFGLNNPADAWRLETEIMFVGDSFTHGVCVDNDMHFVHAVRQRYHGTINLGFSGNGPLVELAGVREYGTPRRPRYVFWMYDEANDVLTYSPPSDLEVETAHPVISKYLNEPAFTQNLYARQPLINAAVNAAAESWTAPPPRTFRQFLLLPRTRETLTNAYIGLRVSLPMVLVPETPLPDARIQQFAAIMRMAADEVERWGGRLVFVNLPAHLSACLGRDHPSRQAILDVPRQLGLDMIDMEGPLFDLGRAKGAHALAGEPPCSGHYSEAAYAAVAQVLLDYLRIARGETPGPFWNETVRPDGSRRLIYAGNAHDRSKPLRP